jgi:two-component system sensor histidine kinase SenX3
MDQKGYLYDLLVHDLKGPLSVVATTATSMLSRTSQYGSLTGFQEQGLKRIVRNAKRAQSLLEEILHVARSEERLFRTEHFLFDGLVKDSLADALEPMSSDVADKLRKAERPEEVRRVLEEAGVSVEISGKYCAAPFFHDRKKIELIVENLVSNALKYRTKQVKVCVSGEGEACILVSDDGAGIPEQEQCNLYGRFVQLSNADAPKIEGSGLGLYCVKVLVDAMGGDIECSSKSGRGTTFTVRIPPWQEKEKRV